MSQRKRAGTGDADPLQKIIAEEPSSNIPIANQSSAGRYDDRSAYLLAELRCAALRARLAACDIDAVGVALRGGMIDPDTAVEWLYGCDALEYVAPAPSGGSS